MCVAFAWISNASLLHVMHNFDTVTEVVKIPQQRDCKSRPHDFNKWRSLILQERMAYIGPHHVGGRI